MLQFLVAAVNELPCQVLLSQQRLSGGKLAFGSGGPSVMLARGCRPILGLVQNRVVNPGMDEEGEGDEATASRFELTVIYRGIYEGCCIPLECSGIVG
jgi:hypothetical protein